MAIQIILPLLHLMEQSGTYFIGLFPSYAEKKLLSG
jgi:hypothetical protein